jgi:hypothetical protein
MLQDLLSASFGVLFCSFNIFFFFYFPDYVVPKIVRTFFKAGFLVGRTCDSVATVASMTSDISKQITQPQKTKGSYMGFAPRCTSHLVRVALSLTPLQGSSLSLDCVCHTHHHCDKIPGRNDLRKGGYILAHRFSESIMVGGHFGAERLTSQRSRESTCA